MTDYYVSKYGSNTSPFDTWAKAATTVQAALNAVAAGGGHNVIVAPGAYNERITDPANNGVAGSPNYLIGDTDLSWSGGGARSGSEVAGQICIYGPYSSANLSGSWNFNLAKHWRMMNLYFNSFWARGTSATAYAVGIYMPQGSTPEGIAFISCIGFGEGIPNGFRPSVSAYNGTQYPVEVTRCLLLGNGPVAYTTGGSTTSFPSTPNIIFKETIAMSFGNSAAFITYTGLFDVNSDDVNRYAYVEITDCFGYGRLSTQSFARRANATFHKIDTTRDVAMCGKFTVASGYNASTDCFQFGSADAEPTGWTELDKPAHDILAGTLKCWAGLNSISTARTGDEAYDFRGADRSTQTTPGPFEDAIFSCAQGSTEATSRLLYMGDINRDVLPWYYYAQQ